MCNAYSVDRTVPFVISDAYPTLDAVAGVLTEVSLECSNDFNDTYPAGNEMNNILKWKCECTTEYMQNHTRLFWIDDPYGKGWLTGICNGYYTHWKSGLTITLPFLWNQTPSHKIC